jgi:hypothetical protein
VPLVAKSGAKAIDNSPCSLPDERTRPVMSRNVVLTPPRTTAILPVFCTTKIRDVSPAGAVT